MDFGSVQMGIENIINRYMSDEDTSIELAEEIMCFLVNKGELKED